MEGYKKTIIGYIPEDWNLAKLRRVSNFSNGKGHEKNIVEDGRFIVVNSKFISTDGKVRKFSDKCLSPLKKNDIAMVMSDIPNGKAIAKCFLVDADETYTLNQRIGSITAHDNVDSRFLCMVLNRNKYYLAFDNGVGQTNLRKDEVLDCPIQLPSQSEQQKIADILSTIDKKIEVIDQQIIETEELKKGLMQRLFTKGIGHTEFKDSQLLKVPKSWEVKRIGEIAKTFAGGTPKRNKPEYFSGGTIPWVKSGEVSSRFINSTEESVTETALKESSARWIPEDSLLIAMYGATAGQVGILKIPACSNQAVLAVVPSQNKFTIPFLYYYLSEATPDLLKMVQGSGQPNLSKGIVDSLHVPLPPEAEQMEIAEILDCISDKCGILSKKKKEYQQLKKALMQQLLTGEIRVNTPIEA